MDSEKVRIFTHKGTWEEEEEEEEEEIIRWECGYLWGW